MKPDKAKPTPAEKKFDQAKEEAFSNEGAPPPAKERGRGAALDRVGPQLPVKSPGRGC